MLKKINILFLCLITCACASSHKPQIRRADFEQDIFSEQPLLQTTQDENVFRVAMLVPLTGSASPLGQGLKNAALLALDDVNNPKLVLQFYDTKSTAEGARTAIENAIEQRARLVIGPLSRFEVQAISDQALEHDIPVLAFSTSKDVLRPQIYTLGLLIDEQVYRILSYASQQGRKRFALMVPDNSSGQNVAKAALIAAEQYGVDVTKIAFYNPNSSNFSEIIQQLTNYQERNALLVKTKQELTYLAEQGNISAQNQLKQLETTNSLGDVGFDAVIIPEYGSKLKSIISMFGYYDVYAPEVKFLGTSIWESSRLNKESMIIRSWYPTLSRFQSAYFSNKYSKLFQTRPNSLYSFAYDAVALSSTLTNYERSEDLNQALTNPDGYVGINGAFRLFENGYNQHSLDIMEIRPRGDVVVNKAPKRFSEEKPSYSESDRYGSYQRIRPLVFGKSQKQAEELFFGEEIYNGNDEYF